MTTVIREMGKYGVDFLHVSVRRRVAMFPIQFRPAHGLEKACQAVPLPPSKVRVANLFRLAR